MDSFRVICGNIAHLPLTPLDRAAAISLPSPYQRPSRDLAHRPFAFQTRRAIWDALFAAEWSFEQSRSDLVAHSTPDRSAIFLCVSGSSASSESNLVDTSSLASSPSPPTPSPSGSPPGPPAAAPRAAPAPPPAQSPAAELPSSMGRSVGKLLTGAVSVSAKAASADAPRPAFDDVSPRNVTAAVGQSAILRCRVKNLGERRVSQIKVFDLLFCRAAACPLPRCTLWTWAVESSHFYVFTFRCQVSDIGAKHKPRNCYLGKCIIFVKNDAAFSRRQWFPPKRKLEINSETEELRTNSTYMLVTKRPWTHFVPAEV